MKVQDKIRLMREEKGWSQEEMAAKLHMSTNGYAKIERGETKAHTQKLGKIADVHEVDLLELMSFGEKHSCQIGDNNHLIGVNNNGDIINSSQELVAEIQRLKVTIEHQNEIIACEKRETVRLNEIIGYEKREVVRLNDLVEQLKNARDINS
jgi:transcriptional regulator with XRE-family HTH domain